MPKFLYLSLEEADAGDLGSGTLRAQPVTLILSQSQWSLSIPFLAGFPRSPHDCLPDYSGILSAGFELMALLTVNFEAIHLVSHTKHKRGRH